MYVLNTSISIFYRLLNMSLLLTLLLSNCMILHILTNHFAQKSVSLLKQEKIKDYVCH